MLRFGILSFAHLHANSYGACLKELPGLTFVGIADDDADRGRERAAHFGVQYFASNDALLAEVDAVIICAENARHHALTLQAAAAGKHILCEKPLATTIADAREMIDACTRAGVKLQTAFPCRYSPAFAFAQQALAEGAVGSVLAVNATNHGANPGGWFNDLALAGGGAVMDHTVHVADLLRVLLADEVRRVYAEIGNRIYESTFDDTGALTLEFEQGVFATLDTSWSRPRRSFYTWGDVTMEIIGTEGNLTLDLFGQHLLAYREELGQAVAVDYGPNLDALMIADFAAAIAEDRPVRVTGLDGLRAVEVALAAYESSRRGEPVEVIHA